MRIFYLCYDHFCREHDISTGIVHWSLPFQEATNFFLTRHESIITNSRFWGLRMLRSISQRMMYRSLIFYAKICTCNSPIYQTPDPVELKWFQHNTITTNHAGTLRQFESVFMCFLEVIRKTGYHSFSS